MQEREFWRTIKVKVTPKTRQFFSYCNRKGYILSKKITGLLELYADYIEEKEKNISKKEAEELKQKFIEKGV